jgi:Tat protein translocase TatB subunit
MFNLGFSELILLGVIALVFIGPDQLPELARVIGRLLNEWKRATSDFQSTITTDLQQSLQQKRIDALEQEELKSPETNTALAESLPPHPPIEDPEKENKS